MTGDPTSTRDTTTEAYSSRLADLRSKRWKRYAPNPYRWWLRHQQPGFLLDIGCGIGRSLAMVDGHGVGVDHNPHSVEACRDAGFEAFTPDDFAASTYAVPGRFDALVCSHVLEHMEPAEAEALLAQYLPFVRHGGKVLLITPQERGFASDATHVHFVDGDELLGIASRLGLRNATTRSFPLPRAMGRAFIYNEFVATATV